MAAQPFSDRLNIGGAVAQAAGSPRRRGDVEHQSRQGLDAGLAQHQPALAFVDQLGPDPAVALGKAEIVQAHVGHDLAGIGQEQPAPEPRHLEEQVLDDVIADVSHLEELPEHGQHGPIEAKNLQKLPEGGGFVALEQRQQQGGRAEAGLAGGAHIRVAMDGRKRQFVVLHRVDLALEQVGGEVKTARHRQA